MKLNLVKFHFEVPKPVDKIDVYRLQMAIVSTIYENCIHYQHNSSEKLGFGESDIKRLLCCEELSSIYLVGIVPRKLSYEDTKLYKKLLSLEYCVNGREIRVLRPAFERVLLEFRG